MKKIFTVIFITVAILFFETGCKKDEDPQIIQYDYSMIFTRGIDSENQPLDNLNSFSLTDFDGQRIYCYTKWFNLEIKEYDYKSYLYDGESNLLYSGSLAFSPTSSTYNTWTYISVDAATHKPGEWRFEIKMDGQDAASGTIDVTP